MEKPGYAILVYINKNMPTYTFRNKDTEEIYDKIMSWNSREEYLKENPNLETIIGAPAMGDVVRLGIRKPDQGFNEVLSKIHAANYKSNLADKLSRK
jgi:hypothetical protein